MLETYSRLGTGAALSCPLYLGLFPEPNFFQANLALLILQADCFRRRKNIIRLLSLPVSRGGRLDLPLVWLCFAQILTF